MGISRELFFVSIERGQSKSLEKKQRNAKSRWKNDSEMQKVVGKMTATIAKVA